MYNTISAVTSVNEAILGLVLELLIVQQLSGGDIITHECKCAIKEMKKNKSAGHDGLTAEFYLFFWSKISKLLIYSLNEGYFKGQLSHTQKHSVLSLLYKKGDPKDIENWRPISLLNTDYKMVAKSLG